MNQTIITAVFALLGSGVTYLFTRKKNIADVRQVQANAEHVEMSSVETAIKIWRELAAELKTEVIELRLECKQLGEEVDALRKENHLLKGDLKRLKTSIDKNTNT